MAKYYFEKWSLKTAEIDVRAYESGTDEHLMTAPSSYKKGQPNLNTRQYDFVGSQILRNATNPKLFFYPPILSRYEGDTSEYAVLISYVSAYRVEGTIKKLDRIKDTLVENIVADESEYPLDGIQDDYWYVRGEKAFPSLKIQGIGNISGAKLKDSTGQIRNVGNVYFKDSNGLVRNLK